MTSTSEAIKPKDVRAAIVRIMRDGRERTLGDLEAATGANRRQVAAAMRRLTHWGLIECTMAAKGSAAGIGIYKAKA